MNSSHRFQQSGATQAHVASHPAHAHAPLARPAHAPTQAQAPESVSVQAAALAAQGGAILKLFVKGFSQMEHRLLNGTVLLSKRRQPQLHLLAEAQAQEADVVLIDAIDAAAMRWAADKTWMRSKAVIWVDAKTAQIGHTVVRRPVQWPIIPMVLARALEQGPTQATASQDVARARHGVLVVDDSLAVRAHLRSLLGMRSLAVDYVESAEAAVEAAARKQYDCILMDVLMPGMDGYEGCRRIKAGLKSGATTAVVMLTSRSSPFDRIRGKMAGCDEYLTKPVAPPKLYQVLSQYLDGVGEVSVAGAPISGAA